MLNRFFENVPFEETRWGLSNGMMADQMAWTPVSQPIVEVDWAGIQRIGLRICVDHAMRALAEAKDMTMPADTPCREAFFTWNDKEYLALLFYGSDERGATPAYQFMIKKATEQTTQELARRTNNLPLT